MSCFAEHKQLGPYFVVKRAARKGVLGTSHTWLPIDCTPPDTFFAMRYAQSTSGLYLFRVKRQKGCMYTSFLCICIYWLLCTACIQYTPPPNTCTIHDAPLWGKAEPSGRGCFASHTFYCFAWMRCTPTIPFFASAQCTPLPLA